MVSMIMELIMTNTRNLKCSKSEVNQIFHHVTKVSGKNPQNGARYDESDSSNIIQKRPFKNQSIQKTSSKLLVSTKNTNKRSSCIKFYDHGPTSVNFCPEILFSAEWALESHSEPTSHCALLSRLFVPRLGGARESREKVLRSRHLLPRT